MDNDLIFSLYPDPSKYDRDSNYSIQIVDKQDYYPPEIEVVVEEIRKSASSIERENAIDRFYKLIQSNKEVYNEVIQSIEEREKINLRPIYVLISENGTILKSIDDEVIYIGGLLLGGNLILDHDLNPIEHSQKFFLLHFDQNKICTQYEETKILTKRGEQILSSSNDLNNLPLIIDETSYHLSRAVTYYKSEYDKISSMNDFAPLIDSSLTAANALIKSNLRNLRPYPDILRQKLDQYSIPETQRPDFLCMQKYIHLRAKEINFLGYTFVSNGRVYSLNNGEMFGGLKYMLVAETTLDKLRNTIKRLRSDGEFQRYIKEYESNISKLGKTAINQFEGRLSEGIRVKVGRKALHTALDNAHEYWHKIPLGLFKLIHGPGGYKFLLTSLDEYEIPIEYLSVLDTFNNISHLISFAVLGRFNYNVDLLNFHFIADDLRFVISIKPEKEIQELYEGMISLEIQRIESLQVLYSYRFREVPEWVDKFMDSFDLSNLFVHYPKIMATMGVELASEIRYLDLSDVSILKPKSNSLPLMSLTERLLGEKIVPVLLKRIIREIENFETESENKQHNARSTMDQYNQDTINLRENRYKKSENNKHSISQAKLEKEMNIFNEGLFDFIVNSFRRGEFKQPSEDLITSVKFLFEDILVAMVDFGLEPQQWVHASNIQIINTYNSQVKWMQYSFISLTEQKIDLTIREEDIDKLIQYNHSKNQVYSTFRGNIKGDYYIAMKKAYLYFSSKITKYQEILKSARTIDMMINIIEQEEDKSRHKIKRDLPKLPSFYN